MQIKYQILRYSNFHKKDVRKIFGPILSSILGPTLFLLRINDLPDNVFCNIAIYADDTAIYSKCDKASNLQQQLVSAPELESDQQDTGLGRKWLANFNAANTQLVSFDRYLNTSTIDVKMNGSVAKVVFLF